MDLIDRYLVAVRRHLPEPLQKDVAEELADSLRSEAEAAEQRLGRPLTPTEQEQLLQPHGHPWLMASHVVGGPDAAVANPAVLGGQGRQ